MKQKTTEPKQMRSNKNTKKKQQIETNASEQRAVFCLLPLLLRRCVSCLPLLLPLRLRLRLLLRRLLRLLTRVVRFVLPDDVRANKTPTLPGLPDSVLLLLLPLPLPVSEVLSAFQLS